MFANPAHSRFKNTEQPKLARRLNVRGGRPSAAGQRHRQPIPVARSYAVFMLNGGSPRYPVPPPEALSSVLGAVRRHSSPLDTMTGRPPRAPGIRTDWACPRISTGWDDLGHPRIDTRHKRVARSSRRLIVRRRTSGELGTGPRFLPGSGLFARQGEEQAGAAPVDEHQRRPVQVRRRRGIECRGR